MRGLPVTKYRAEEEGVRSLAYVSRVRPILTPPRGLESREEIERTLGFSCQIQIRLNSIIQQGNETKR